MFLEYFKDAFTICFVIFCVGFVLVRLSYLLRDFIRFLKS